jgi:diaminopropionate ammonia-lyase
VARVFVAARPTLPPALFSDADYATQRSFFASHVHLAPTPLRRLRALGRALGVGDLRVKDETRRFGLNAFKATGALFATAQLRDRGELSAGDVVVCASEGNHGRAVARAAREIGCSARVYMAETATAARVSAIEAEGATVILVPGTYDDAMRAMTREARAHGWRVISDTALDDDAFEVPRLIMLGYTRIMDEIEAELDGTLPEVVFVPGGVGGLLAATADWARTRGGRPAVVCVEPLSAACLQVSARAGRPTTVPGPFETIMAGLRCGEVSRAGFDTVLGGVAAYLAIEDQWAVGAMRHLAAGAGGDSRLEVGASGAAALGGLLAAVRDPLVAELKAALDIGPASRIVVLATEGVTDPDLFATIAGSPTSEHPKAEQREP